MKELRKLKRRINVTVEKTKTGFSAYADDMAVYTTAKDIQNLYKNLIEALNLFYKQKGYFVSSDNLKLHLDLREFFQYYRVINADFLAKRIGMNPTLLSQYVRGKKTPSEKQSNKIIEGIHSIGKELSCITLQY